MVPDVFLGIVFPFTLIESIRWGMEIRSRLDTVLKAAFSSGFSGQNDRDHYTRLHRGMLSFICQTTIVRVIQPKVHSSIKEMTSQHITRLYLWSPMQIEMLLTAILQQENIKTLFSVTFCHTNL